MSLIDWSDPAEMFGLLLEFVADEQSEAEDATRRAFLARLRQQLESLQTSLETSPEIVATALRSIHQSVPAEFRADDVVQHLNDCVVELERI